MVKHIVCFKLTDSSDEGKKKAKDVLRSMVGNVPTIRRIEIGCDFLCSERSFDIVLQVLLDDKAALEEYQNDKYHCDVVKTYMHANTTATVAIDYIV